MKKICCSLGRNANKDQVNVLVSPGQRAEKKRALVPTLTGPLEDQGQGGTILKHCPYLAEQGQLGVGIFFSVTLETRLTHIFEALFSFGNPPLK